MAAGGYGQPGLYSFQVNTGQGYAGDFYWQGGSSNIADGESTFGPMAMASRYFGFQLTCGKATCQSPSEAAIQVSWLALTIHETTPPALSASGLWQATGWVRGTWPFGLSSDSPAGVCLLATSLNGVSVGETTSGGDQTVWHQCNAGAISQTVDTARYGQGALPFGLLAADAAAQHSSANETLYVDNQPPTVSLSGPTDAPSTAGTQYVTATPSAGPSGVAGILCSADGAPDQSYAGSTAQVPVSGVGTHQVQCVSQNNALDSDGNRGTSDAQSYSMRIYPTVAGAAFSKVVNKLRCHRATVRVRVGGRWVKVRRHGKLVRVHRKAHYERKRVTRCHPRTVRRRVTRLVKVRRHSKRVRVKRTKFVRVVLEPRTVFKTHLRVGHGKPATVYGWLGASTGSGVVALGGQTVDVLTAADNGRNNYHVAAVTTTAADGSWSAQLPPGPSRLVSASYAGSPDTEPALATPIELAVPAKVQLLSVTPDHIPWGGVVHLVGRLRGGYLPRGGALVRLRIGEYATNATYGVRTHVTGNGRFTASYRFGAGDPAVHRAFWFQIASLPIGNYPWAPAASRRLTVHVGGDPKPPSKRRQRRR